MCTTTRKPTPDRTARRVVPSLILILGLFWVHSLTAAPAAKTGLQALQEPRPAPEMNLHNRQGEPRSLADYRGKVVILNFWAIWCAPCVAEMPSMQRAWEAIRDQDGVMLAVNWGDSAEDIEVFFDKRLKEPVDFPVLIGTERDVSKAWGFRGLPTTYILDPEGRIVYEAVGEREWDDPELLERIMALKEQ